MFSTYLLCEPHSALTLSYRANDIAKEKKRTKITADDVFTALKELGFDKYESELKEFLRNYNTSKEDQAARLQTQKRKAEETNGGGVGVQKRSQVDADDYQFEM